jgi:hypothetical protein
MTELFCGMLCAMRLTDMFRINQEHFGVGNAPGICVFDEYNNIAWQQSSILTTDIVVCLTNADKNGNMVKILHPVAGTCYIQSNYLFPL